MKTFKQYNESLRDKMAPKSEEDIRRTFEKKYGIKYLDLANTVLELNKYDVEAELKMDNPREPIEIQPYSITRVTGSNGWGLGKSVSEKQAKMIAKFLDENMDEFWKEDSDYKRYYEVEKERHGSFNVSHKDALKILAKMKELNNEEV